MTATTDVNDLLRRLRASLASIGGRLFATMMLTAMLVTVVVGGTEVWAGYRDDLRKLEADLERIRLASLDPIALSLWQYDDDQLRLQLDGIRQRPFVAAVEVREPSVDDAEGALLARAGVEVPAEARVERLPLVFHRDGETVALGTLAITFDVGALRRRAEARTLSILATQGAITLLIGMVLLLVVRQVVTRHLSALADAAQDFDLRDDRASFRVRRRGDGPGDEIDRVIEALETMRSSLRGAYRTLADTNDELQADNAARLRAEAAADHLAHHDALTDLPNRRLLLQRLAHELALAERSGTCGALMFIDIDHFKMINDAHGHSIGDAALVEAALRLRASLREIDLVARLGGDEFVVLLPMLGEQRERATHTALLTAEKLRTVLSEPIVIRDKAVKLTASVGVAMFPDDGDTPEHLMKHADTAMYLAKSEGRDAVRFFQRELLEAMEERLALEGDLRRAVAEDGLDVAYQPLIDASGRVHGGEALVRWTHPVRGPVSPAQFIPLCEESGLIVALGDWVLRTVLAQVRRWRDSGVIGPEQYLSVNISPRQFRQQGFDERLLVLLHEHDVPPSMLVLELTEGVVLDDIDNAIQRMNTLRARGIRFYIDDFGTGYSSMAYLKRLPADGLKIDKGFVRDLASDANDAAIVDAILAMGRHFGLTVVAEGVETEAQARYLIERDCDLLQGDHPGRPGNAGTFAANFLRRQRPVPPAA